MPRTPRRPRAVARPTRAQLHLEILHHLELARDRGMTRAELVAAIGPERTSLPTVHRALVELRGESYDAPIVYDGKTRRWRLEGRVALPLDAPQAKDVVAGHLARAMLEPLVDAETLERITRIVEGLDERARKRTSPGSLPARKALAATLTAGTRIDPDVFLEILAACRRKPILIRHASPWHAPVDEVKWQEVEPWSLRVHDGVAYLRAWSTVAQGVRTFRLADIDAVRDLDGPPIAPRHLPPADPWADENPASGIDHDRPNTAVIRLRGGVARWVARVSWHPSEKDVWLERGELLERTVPYRSCREMARRLVSILDGIESIEPAELCDEVVALAAHGDRLRRRARARMSRRRSGRAT